MQTWSEKKEISRFLAVAEAHGAYGPIWRLMEATGVRRGEALGVRWQDIDFERQTVRIAQTVSTIGGKTEIIPRTKTLDGCRRAWPRVAPRAAQEHES